MPREISEHDATLAVDAAAKHFYERSVANYADQVPTWDELDMVKKRNIKDMVLDLVWAALGALPDQRRAAWGEGYDKAWHNWTGTHDLGEHANPYPAEEA